MKVIGFEELDNIIPSFPVSTPLLESMLTAHKWYGV